MKWDSHEAYVGVTKYNRAIVIDTCVFEIEDYLQDNQPPEVIELAINRFKVAYGKGIATEVIAILNLKEKFPGHFE